MMTGLVVKIGTQPQLATDTFTAAAFGARDLEWSTPTYALTGLVLSYLEPDPDTAWDDRQLQRFQDTLNEILEVLSAS